MKGALDIANNVYFRASTDNLKSIDIKGSNLFFSDINNKEATLNVRLSLIDYGKNLSNFKVRIYLPESLREDLQDNFIELGEVYQTGGNRDSIEIMKKVIIPLEEGTAPKKIMDTHWDWDAYKFELYNESNTTELVYHGI